MRRWPLALLLPFASLSCGDSNNSSTPGPRAGATSGGASGSAGTTSGGSAGASGTNGTAGVAGIAAGGTSGTSGGNAGSGATGGTGTAGSGGTAGASGTGEGGDGASGDAGAAGEAGSGGDDTFHAQSIDAGGNHTCALLDSRDVICWGQGADGQLGDGGSSTRFEPVLADITDVVHVSAGSGHTCAVQTSGLVKCWGQDLFGQLGNGLDNLNDKPRPVDVSDLEDAIAVAAGGAHTCALVRGGTVKCWGDDWEGQLGNGSDGEMGHESPVDVVNITNAIAITAGSNHTCAIIDGGTVQCWGDNLAGQLGIGYPGGIQRSPANVSGLDEVVAISAGAFHTCALRQNGEVFCWGSDTDGTIGDGEDDEADELSPVPVMTASAATSIAAGSAHSCASLVDGTVQCWGRDNDGQIGDGDDDQQNHTSPETVLGLENAVFVTAGPVHACALTETGQVHCWGNDMNGQIGDGDDGQGDQVEPVGVVGF